LYGGLTLLWLACARAAPDAPQPQAAPIEAQETLMETTIQVVEPRIPAASALRVVVTVTNRGSEPIPVNLLLTPYTSVVLEVKEAAGKPVPKSPPPVPPKDDGKSMRTFAPGESATFEYAGSALFGMSLAPGSYQIRFRTPTGPAPGTWSGELASDWATFTVG
jgi:hypothetical protein